MWKRVVAPTALVSLLWVAVSCGTWYALNLVDTNQTRLLNESRSVIHAAGAMQENLWRLQAVLLENAQNNSGSRERFKGEAGQLDQAFERALIDAGQNASTSAERDFIAAITSNFGRYRTLSHELLFRDGKASTDASSSVEKAMSAARAVAEPCEQLSELARRLTNDAFQRRDRWMANVNAARIAFIIVGPAVGIFLGWWVARGLHHSISEISVTLRDARGDLEQEIGSVEVHPLDNSVGLPALQQQVQYVSGRIKQVVDELHRARGEALRSERLATVGELAAGIAHEVRNPLTSVKLLIQAVERNQPAGSGDHERLKIVRQEIARIETTMQELLDYAKPPKLHRIRHDVRETLRRALNLVDGRARQAEVAIEERLPAVPIPVDADPEQLNQVFINLLLNAIEAMEAGGRLHVDIETLDDAKRDASQPMTDYLVRVVFRDTGSGIRPDVMERLFEPFVTSKERGIGLGLAISRQIMREHGGRLSACNPQSGGAMFVAELPLATANHDDASTALAPSGAAGIVHASENSRAEAMEIVNH